MWFLLFVIQFKFPSEQRSHLRFIYLTPLLPHDVVFSHIPLLLPLQNYESRCLANIRQTRELLNSVLTAPSLILHSSYSPLSCPALLCFFSMKIYIKTYSRIRGSLTHLESLLAWGVCHMLRDQNLKPQLSNSKILCQIHVLSREELVLLMSHSNCMQPPLVSFISMSVSLV